MYDRQTGTLWSQLLGEGVEGPLMGTKLRYLPAMMTTWEDWKTQHPDTLALRKGYSGDRDPYNSYYASGSRGVIRSTVDDNRLNAKDLILGIEHEDLSIAFPYETLSGEPVINHRIGDTPILVVFNRQTSAGAAFSRQLDGRTLTFEQQEGLELVDDQTGTRWNGLTGIGIEGPLAGQQLEQLKSTSSFWFGWNDFHPGTEVYDGN